MMLTPFGAAKNGGKELVKVAAKEGAEFVSENVAKTVTKTTAKEVAKTTGETLTENIAKTTAKTTAKEATEVVSQNLAKTTAKEVAGETAENIAKTATTKSFENVVKNTAKTSSMTASKTNRKDGAISNLIEDGAKKREQELLDSKFTGTNWKFDPNKDADMLDKTFHEALDEAFRRTGVPKSEFKVVQWGKDKYGKSVPVEYSGPNGANVNLDIPKYNNPTNGPNIPHIGYKSGKKNDKTVGHIFVDGVPATRYKE